MTTRPVSWLGSSRNDVRAFPEDARARIGYELFRVQRGVAPTDWRPMVGIGRGVIEMRVHTGREYRVLYVTRLPDAIHVVHAFEKRTRQTRRVDVDVARSRYRALMRRRID